MVRKLRIAFTFCLLLFSVGTSSAQYVRYIVDSLKRELSEATSDSTRSLIYAELSYRLYLDPDSAYQMAMKGLALAEKKQFIHGVSANYFSLGNYYGVLDDFPKAYEFLAKALTLQLQSGTISEQLRTYFVLGTLEARQKDYPKSIRYLKEGYALARKSTEASMDVVLLLNNLGCLYTLSNESDSSLYYLNMGLSMAREMKSKSFEATLLQSIGENYLAQEKFNEAESCFLKSIELNEHEDQRVQLITYLDLSETYLKNLKTEVALTYANAALLLADSLPDLMAKQRAEQLLYSIYKKQGLLDKSLFHLERSMTLTDSLFTVEKMKEVKRLQTLIELNQKEFKIRILQQDNALHEAALLTEKQRVAFQRYFTGSLVVLVALVSILLLLIQSQSKVRKRLIYTLQEKANLVLEQNNEIRLLNEKLEERDEQRTRSIITQARKLEEYVFLNSHRLRGPVATLLGLLHLIDIKSVDVEERPFILGEVQNQVKQIDEVVREISRVIE